MRGPVTSSPAQGTARPLALDCRDHPSHHLELVRARLGELEQRLVPGVRGGCRAAEELDLALRLHEARCAEDRAGVDEPAPREELRHGRRQRPAIDGDDAVTDLGEQVAHGGEELAL